MIFKPRDLQKSKIKRYPLNIKKNTYYIVITTVGKRVIKVIVKESMDDFLSQQILAYDKIQYYSHSFLLPSFPPLHSSGQVPALLTLTPYFTTPPPRLPYPTPPRAAPNHPPTPGSHLHRSIARI